MAQFDTPRITHNRLLAAMPKGARERFLLKADKVPIARRAVLHRPNERVAHVYFIESGWVSMMSTSADGQQTGVGLAGHEGFLGLSLLCGVNTEYAEAVVQGSGTAWRMAAGVFLEEMKDDNPIRSILLQYAEAMRNQLMQTVTCVGHHGLEQRLARCILMSDDCAGGHEIRATQEMLAAMLCVHRPSVTLAANALREAGCIDYRGGIIIIRSRDNLERAVCDCYEAVKQRFESIFSRHSSPDHSQSNNGKHVIFGAASLEAGEQ